MQHDRAALIVAHDVERVLTDINADYGDCGIELLIPAARTDDSWGFPNR